VLKETIRSMLPRGLRAHRILAGPIAGARIFTSWHDYPGAIRGTTERPLLDWLARNASGGETWLDVGGHYGYTSIALCRFVGTAGRVFCFEPVLETAGCVARTRRLNDLRQLSIVPMGLGACFEPQPRRLPTVRGMADSTIARGEWEEPISVVALDSLWPAINGGHDAIHGVKIDVQGMELEALEGMRGTLARHRPKLVVEFHTGVDRTAILELLERCGYEPHGKPVDSGPSTGYADDRSYVFHASAAVRWPATVHA
jgi:FkbM family methyltransferase